MVDPLHSELFDPQDSQTFLDAFCAKRCVHFEQDVRDRFEHLLPWDAINTLLTLNLMDDKRLRVVKDSRDLPTSFYRRDNERKTVNAAKLTALVEQGASLSINGIQALVPEIRRMADQIERWLSVRVNVNAYLSFSKGGAFTSHFDMHDVLVLQIHGNKAWTVYDEPAEYPLLEQGFGGRHAGRGKPVLLDPVLRQGDILFVPRGYYHQAAVQDGLSVHLTFGLNAVRGMEVVDALRAQCLADAAFRTDVHRHAGAATLAAQEADLKARLHALVDAISLDGFLTEKTRARKPHDVFRLGPAAPLPDDPVLVPLVRRRDGGAPPAGDDPVAGRVIERLIDRHRMTLRQLCDSFDGEIDADDVRSTVDGLVAGRLVELA